MDSNLDRKRAIKNRESILAILKNWRDETERQDERKVRKERQNKRKRLAGEIEER